MQAADLALELDEVLPVLELLDDGAVGRLLAVREAVEHPVALEQTGDVVDERLETRFGSRHVRRRRTAAGGQWLRLRRPA